MKIEVKHLLSQPEGTTENHQIEQANLELGEEGTINVVGNVTLTKLSDFILANVSGEAQVILPCHRCLKPTIMNMGLDFSSQFYPQLNPELEGYPIDDSQINLTTPIIDEITASLPIKILCQNNCLGLCPICGNNLNDNPCKCDRVEFEVLNKIRFEDGSPTKEEN